MLKEGRGWPETDQSSPRLQFRLRKLASGHVSDALNIREPVEEP